MAQADFESANIYGGGYGGGYSYGGGFFPGFVGGIFGGALLGRRGLGDCDGHRGGVDNTLAYLAGRDGGLEAKTSDVVAATASLTSTMVNGFKDTADVTRSTGAVLGAAINSLDGKTTAGFFGVERGLCENRHASDLQFAAIQKDMALQHCAIEKAINCDGEKTRAMLVQQNENRLLDKLEATRFQLNEVQRERDLLATGNFPVSQQVNVEKCHGHSHRDGIDIRFNAIGNDINAINAQNQQVIQALNGLATAIQSKLK